MGNLLVLYVAGPVIRPNLDPHYSATLEDIYDRVEGWCKQNRIGVEIPRLGVLENSIAEDFHKSVKEQISLSTHVLTVAVAPTVSAGGEAIIASVMGKPHAVLHSENHRAPRLLTGAPYFVKADTPANLEALLVHLTGSIGPRRRQEPFSTTESPDTQYMNRNLGRDKVWNDHIWSEIDKAVRDEMGRLRVAQKVFPSTIANNVPVLANTVVSFGNAAPYAALRTGDDVYKPFIEISIEFVLTQAQVDGEENMHLAPSLARLAASAIATVEDTVLFFGPGSIPLIAGTGVTVTNLSAFPKGFVDEAAAYLPLVNVRGAIPLGAPPPTSVGDIIGAVAQGMAYLNARAQPGPYALFLSPERYAQTFAPYAAGQLETPGDQINHVVTGGFYMVNCLAVPPPPAPPPPEIGILVSLGGEPAKIILGTDATTAFAFTDPQGNYHFRVFERIQLTVRDGRAFQTLAF